MKSSKNMNKNASIITRDTAEMSRKSGNIYSSIVIVAKRAKQIATATKEELSMKLVDFASHVDNLEEIHENKEQIEISKYYEKLPKPVSISLDEFMSNTLEFRLKDSEEG